MKTGMLQDADRGDQPGQHNLYIHRYEEVEDQCSDNGTKYRESMFVPSAGNGLCTNDCECKPKQESDSDGCLGRAHQCRLPVTASFAAGTGAVLIAGMNRTQPPNQYPEAITVRTPT